MFLNVSAIVLLALVACLLIRSKHVGCGAAIVLFLFGFFAAGTGAYGPIRSACQVVADALANLRT
jgi:hypothetical protein